MVAWALLSELGNLSEPQVSELGKASVSLKGYCMPLMLFHPPLMFLRLMDP